MNQLIPPCKDCLIIPVCRNRLLQDILHNCDKAYAYLFYLDHKERIARRILKLYYVVRCNYSVSKWVTIYPLLYEEIEREIRARGMIQMGDEEMIKMR